MMKLDLSQIKPIPGFDSLKWKREAQAEIYRETEGMTRKEIREYFRKGNDESIEERKHKIATMTKDEQREMLSKVCERSERRDAEQYRQQQLARFKQERARQEQGDIKASADNPCQPAEKPS